MTDTSDRCAVHGRRPTYEEFDAGVCWWCRPDQAPADSKTARWIAAGGRIEELAQRREEQP